ncbi:MAG: hypothetical protein QOI11_1197 [Candidatus Eremiobacteraeota bacterium]|jgi:acetyl esterase/lipase|nr:hypothetical protein [Candidatus Eremiobacteraeota bacterium]
MKRLLLTIPCCVALTLALAVGASATPYFELDAPSASYAGQAPKGWVILVHGGGWDGIGTEQVQRLRTDARRFTNRGWATMNVDYRAGASSLTDVVSFYDLVRSRMPVGKLCLYGQSAGGQLVLMAAEARTTVSCVMVEGAPTNLRGLATQTSIDPDTARQQTVGPRFVYGKAIAAFGLANLEFYSPLTWASKLRSPTLMSSATNDELVPVAQMNSMRVARTKVKVMRLAGTTSTTSRSVFTHGYITPAARSRWEAAKTAMMAAAR